MPPDSDTPNYHFIKPEQTGSIDTWGGKLNTNFDIADAVIKTNETTAKNSMQKAGTAAERTALDYLFLDDSHLDSDLQGNGALMTNRAVRKLLNAVLPIGTVIQWAGTVATIPDMWALCNGQISNGQQTPNMLDRFVVQAGSTFTPGQSGGTNTLTVSTRVGGTVLTVDHLAAHSHALAQDPHGHGLSDPTHAHSYMAGANTGLIPYNFPGNTLYPSGVNATTTYNATGIGIAGGLANIGVYNNGSNWAHDHPISFAIPYTQYWPQFFAICFIMKVKNF